MQRSSYRAKPIIALLFAGALIPAGLHAAAAVTVSISPNAYTLRVTQTKTFSASVANSTIRTVTWSVNGVVGGNTTVGTISTAGLYAAPATVPVPNVVKIRATSTVAPNPFAEAAMTLQNPEPTLTSVTPNAVNIGTFTIRLGWQRLSANVEDPSRRQAGGDDIRLRHSAQGHAHRHGGARHGRRRGKSPNEQGETTSARSF